METKESRCRNCEAVLDMDKAVNGVIECLYCHSFYTIPKENASSPSKELLKIAENELDNCAFDRAYVAFKKASVEDITEPECYFGMALSNFKVQFLKDAAKQRLQPICHDITEKKFSEDKNYLKALELATAEQRKIYAQKAEEIDEIGMEFLRLKNAGIKYDCFLCVKVSDEQGGNTKDSYEALKLYNHLKKRGYKPFYSEEEIRGRTGTQYEAMILYALYTSECMLIVCSKEEYLLTPWVKNEYSRFMELIHDERKDVDAITIVFDGKAIDRLPGKRALIQGVNLNNPDAYTAITDYVESHTPEAKKRKNEEQIRKQQETEEIKRQTEEIRRQMEEQDKARKLLEDKLKTVSVTQAASTYLSMSLAKANKALSERKFKTAKEHFDLVLTMDNHNADAWWGLFKSKNKLVSDKFESPDRISLSSAEIIKNIMEKDGELKIARDYFNTNEFKNAYKNAIGDLRTVIENFKSDYELAKDSFVEEVRSMKVESEKYIDNLKKCISDNSTAEREDKPKFTLFNAFQIVIGLSIGLTMIYFGLSLLMSITTSYTLFSLILGIRICIIITECAAVLILLISTVTYVAYNRNKIKFKKTIKKLSFKQKQLEKILIGW